jgi:hypothetical protein
MGDLKVGMTMFRKYYMGGDNGAQFQYSKIEKINKKSAILENGLKISLEAYGGRYKTIGLRGGYQEWQQKTE